MLTYKKRLKGVLTSKRKSNLIKILKSLSPKKIINKRGSLLICVFCIKKQLKKHCQAQKLLSKFHLTYDASKRLEEGLFLQQIYQIKIPRYLLIKLKERITEEERIILENIFKQCHEIKIFYLTKER